MSWIIRETKTNGIYLHDQKPYRLFKKHIVRYIYVWHTTRTSSPNPSRQLSKDCKSKSEHPNMRSSENLTNPMDYHLHLRLSMPDSCFTIDYYLHNEISVTTSQITQFSPLSIQFGYLTLNTFLIGYWSGPHNSKPLFWARSRAF